MSFELNFFKDSVVATFTKVVHENEIKNAFIEIVDSINIGEVNYLIFDLSKISCSSIPINYIQTIKTLILFSSSWNTNIKVCIVASSPKIRAVVQDIMQKSKEFIWEFNLFDELSLANKWCGKNLMQKKHVKPATS